MDRIADQPPGNAGERAARALPRHVTEHLGQVLRNRLRDTLFMPLSGEMLRAIEALPQAPESRNHGVAPAEAGAESVAGG